VNIEFNLQKTPDLMAVDCALRSINLPSFGGLSCFGKRLLVVFDEGTELSEAQVEAVGAIVNSLADTNDWFPIRKQRGPMLDEADWRIQRALDEGEDATQLIEYRRALRDITKQESPDTVVWPTKPW
jgi:hypothetical protein